MGKREQTREKILQAAWALFEEYGYHATSTRMIARAAEVADGTVFSHFPTKQDLLRASFSRLVEGFSDDLTEELSERFASMTAIEAFFVAANYYYRYYFQYRDLSIALFSEIIWDLNYYNQLNEEMSEPFRDKYPKAWFDVLFDIYLMTLVRYLSDPESTVEQALSALEDKVAFLKT